MKRSLLRTSPGAGTPGSEGIPASLTEHALALIEAICSHVEEAILVVGSDRRIRFANQRAVEVLNLSEHWSGQPLASVTSDYRLVLTVTSCFDHGRPVERSLDPPGRIGVAARALPIVDGGAVAEVVVVVHDQSEIRRLETVRRDFSANISHELRTPAAAIMLMVDTLQAGAMADPDANAEFIGRIGHEAAYMARMIEGLLDLSSVESGLMNQLESVSVADVLNSVERLQPLANERQIALRVVQEHDLPLLWADPVRLGQALRNLVHNAIKFSPSEAEITISAGPANQGRWVRIEVVDRGPGIPPEDLSRVFERFWKGDPSRQRHGEGSGLGLAIARHIAHAHGGSLTATSSPPDGSRFVLVLPGIDGVPLRACAPPPSPSQSPRF